MPFAIRDSLPPKFWNLMILLLTNFDGGPPCGLGETSRHLSCSPDEALWAGLVQACLRLLCSTLVADLQRLYLCSEHLFRP
eukprot:s1143_g13.t1